LIFIVNPFGDDFGGQKTLTKKEQGGTREFFRLPTGSGCALLRTSSSSWIKGLSEIRQGTRGHYRAFDTCYSGTQL
jgi:hypothetical protein